MLLFQGVAKCVPLSPNGEDNMLLSDKGEDRVSSSENSGGDDFDETLFMDPEDISEPPWYGDDLLQMVLDGENKEKVCIHELEY